MKKLLREAGPSAIALLTFAAFVLTPAPARAQTVDATCVGTVALVVNWSPGLKLLQAATDFSSGSSPNLSCVTNGSESATLTSVSGSGQLSCSTSSGVSGTAVITWTPAGGTSTIDISGLAVNSVSKLVTLTGTVSAGRFLNDNATMTFVAVESLTTECADTDGLTQTSGAPTIVLTH